ncbi:MAG: hypothetical protein C4336_00135 [Armatimonadota bacterium]
MNLLRISSATLLLLLLIGCKKDESNPANNGTGGNAIASPITHGSGATGITIVERASTERTITAGVEYGISITGLDGTTGWKEFTP